MEQPGERRETQEIYNWVDKLLPVRGHEKADGGQGQMAPPQNRCSVLKAIANATWCGRSELNSPYPIINPY